ncbi:diaminopimelate decarboxylase [Sulfuriflexus sp.]|uniref:diaminopimelate decarboxylase n=1 Tax=Sulfuriflexus sp. TaxID=2015443 RepID=UPI0028CEA5E0|nr:diaminopimelate decarboxylase [Sulfuriflexus sp.]MDT8405007.1 diaminopimelate decarboxylase [Sulfuriflexus sp.]
MTDFFAYANGVLHAESVALEQIAAQHGTPTYVYSRAAIETQWRAFDRAFDDREHLLCYAVKANSNLAVLNILARLGSGFDIVSVGELERVLAAGGEASRIVFSGVGKRPDEISRALEVGIRCFNVESEAELERINEVAGQLGKSAPISLRVNPDIDAGTHPYISTGLKENKFGIPIEKAADAYAHAAGLEHLDIHGIDCHIGSQLTELSPFADALARILTLIDTLAEKGINLRHIDIGGGLGIRYATEQPPSADDYADTIKAILGDRPQTLIIEPGRAIVGNAGVLLTRVEFLKHGDEHNFAIVDAAMNDLMRPALYSAWQAIDAVSPRPAPMAQMYDIVGPVCETADFLGKQRLLALQQGDLLAVRSSGAYGFSMSSNYNSRPRAAEVMVDGDKVHVIRERETIADLTRGEHLLPE